MMPSMPLPRIQLFELNDSPWVPRPLRDTIVETLSRTLDWGRMLEGLVAPFETFLAATGAAEVLDLCSGAAGPARILTTAITRAGRRPPRFVLTDLHPQLDAWAAAQAAHPAVFGFERAPVDATRVPPALGRGRARVVINALHHFPPDLARGILTDAAAGSAGILVAEGFERNPLRFVPFAPAGLAALAANPLLTARDRAAKALITWCSPVALLASMWDGLVSTLRVYSEAELRELVAALDRFVWTYGTFGFTAGGRGYYFYGVPRGLRGT
jgi:hypothetical protein